MIFGVNATKSAVVIAETKGAGDKFVLTAYEPSLEIFEAGYRTKRKL